MNQHHPWCSSKDYGRKCDCGTDKASNYCANTLREISRHGLGTPDKQKLLTLAERIEDIEKGLEGCIKIFARIGDGRTAHSPAAVVGYNMAHYALGKLREELK